jgi:hypothetical protein
MPEPSKPAAVGNDQLDLALGTPHNLLNMAERNIVIVQHRQLNQISNLDLLGKASRHLGFKRLVLRESFTMIGGLCRGGLLSGYDAGIGHSRASNRGASERHANGPPDR